MDDDASGFDIGSAAASAALYDLDDDPRELENLVAGRRNTARQLRDLLLQEIGPMA